MIALIFFFRLYFQAREEILCSSRARLFNQEGVNRLVTGLSKKFVLKTKSTRRNMQIIMPTKGHIWLIEDSILLLLASLIVQKKLLRESLKWTILYFRAKYL